MKHYDVIVIGSGGGSKITRPAANLGLKVAIIDKGKLGGTCLNHGCIPSKMLIHSADLMAELEDLDRFNLSLKALPKPSFSKLIERVNGVIDKESASIEPLYHKHPNIDYYKEFATFVGKKTVQVGSKTITGDKIFIATGARPHIPDIKGIENVPYQTYFEALRAKKQPKSLIVVGGGYIATELGYFFGMLGTKVEFVVRSEMLKNEDKEISKAFEASFSKRFIVHKKVKPVSVSYKEGVFRLSCDSPGKKKKILKAEGLLIATGVMSATRDLGLEKAGVKVDERGFIEVDSKLKTSAKGIYAFGDCIGKHLFRHSANFQGEYLFKTYFQKGKKRPIDYPPMPHAVFSNPQIGSVGFTEEALKASKKPYIVGKAFYKNSAMGMALRSEEGFVKLLFDKRSKKLIGAHIIGFDAASLIHMPIAYMNMKASLEDMLKTIYVHPALPEVIRNAARDARGKLA